jgi:predicted ester cyclase
MTNGTFPTTGVSEQDLATLKTFYRAFSGQHDLLDDCVTADWQDIPLAPGQEPGREGAKPLISGFSAVFADLKIEIIEMIGVPGKIAVRGVMTGRHVGELFGVAPTGKSFSLPIHEFHTIEDGRLTHTWHMEDWLGWFAQMGAWPALK